MTGVDHREEMRRDFDEVTSGLKEADRAIQVCVGVGLNLSYSMFIKNFESQARFSEKPKSEKIEYINKMSNFEDTIRSDKDEVVAVGIALFKMWLAAVTEGDNQLIEHFHIEMDRLSRLGDVLS